MGGRSGRSWIRGGRGQMRGGGRGQVRSGRGHVRGGRVTLRRGRGQVRGGRTRKKRLENRMNDWEIHIVNYLGECLQMGLNTAQVTLNPGLPTHF